MSFARAWFYFELAPPPANLARRTPENNATRIFVTSPADFDMIQGSDDPSISGIVRSALGVPTSTQRTSGDMSLHVIISSTTMSSSGAPKRVKKKKTRDDQEPEGQPAAKRVLVPWTNM